MAFTIILAEPDFFMQKDFERGEKEAKRVKQWLDDVTDTLFFYRERLGSGFEGSIQSLYTSVAEFGTGCLYIEDDGDYKGIKDGIRYIFVPLEDVWFGSNHQNEVDTVFREFEFTASQIVQKWGVFVEHEKFVREKGRNEI